MSPGLPGLLHKPTDMDDGNVVVHAENWGPDSDRRALGCTNVGHDDVAEHLHLTATAQPDETPLIDQLRAAAAQGWHYLMLRVDGDTVGLGFSRGTNDFHPLSSPGAVEPGPRR